MKRHILAAVVVMVLAVLGIWGFRLFMTKRSGAPAVTDTSVMETQGVANFTSRDLDGNEFDLASMQGKIVILNFWASWCSPCIEEVPSLIKLIQEFNGQVQLIAVSGDSSRSDIEVFLKSFPEFKRENIKIVWDEDRSLMSQFNISRLPESLILGPDQKLIKKIVGSIDWHNKDSIEYMKSRLAK